ncbi:MAG: hypothetical protein M3Z49_09905, partial [Bifidobacteriales bacterium]|nr:hypothetical protein [Bifidobacteriales bacterium]
SNTAVHIVSFDEEHIYWKYRGLYTVAGELKLTTPIERSTSLPSETALTISGDTQMFLLVWSKIVH